MFGYFMPPKVKGKKQEVVFTCLSHDIVAHETAHALLDGLRSRYTMPSVPEQMGFHEGFADIVALLSMFGMESMVATAFERLEARSRGRQRPRAENMVSKKLLEPSRSKARYSSAWRRSSARRSGKRRDALRRSVELVPLAMDGSQVPYLKRPKYREPHNCGEVLVAAVMNAFLKVWRKRLERHFPGGKPTDLDRAIVIDEGTEAANTLLTMVIRGLDYTPPTDIMFGDF